MLRNAFLFSLLCLLLTTFTASAEEKMKALIMDGQNNHAAWPKTTFMMKKYLEETGMFAVDIARTRFTWRGDKHLPKYALSGSAVEFVAVKQPTPDPDFKPDFAKYNLVVSNFGFNAAPWPTETQQAFENSLGRQGPSFRSPRIE